MRIQTQVAERTFTIVHIKKTKIAMFSTSVIDVLIFVKKKGCIDPKNKNITVACKHGNKCWILTVVEQMEVKKLIKESLVVENELHVIK